MIHMLDIAYSVLRKFKFADVTVDSALRDIDEDLSYLMNRDPSRVDVKDFTKIGKNMWRTYGETVVPK